MELDNYEKEILAAYENDEFVQAQNLDQEILIAKQAASAYFKKNARINIRLSSVDLEILKRQAAKEGLAYQSYIASMLHKIASGGS